MRTSLTKSEEKESSEIAQLVYLLTEMIRERFYTPERPPLVYSPKGENGAEWGYYVSPAIGRLVAVLKKNKIKSFIDLGCGAGVLLRVLTMYIPYISVRGIDNEERLVSYCNKIMASGTKKGNILSLKREEIERYEVIYFYEPFRSKKMAQQFVENLSKIVVKGQHIMYIPSGPIEMFLRDVKNIKRVNINTGPWLIYKVTKTL